MSATTEQLRQPASIGSPLDSQFYTASLSPYLQGTEIVQFGQLLNYTNVKIRSNTSPVLALSGSSQGWQQIGDSYHSFDDQFSPTNFGVSSAKSQANLFTNHRFDTYISHYAEQRSLGQTELYDDGNPFVEPDDLKDPTIFLSAIRENIIFPLAMVLAGATTDGVIEAQDIRKVADRTSIDMPHIIRSTKGSLSVSDDNLKSYQFSDTFDLRQTSSGFSASPYLDYVSSIGIGNMRLDQIGAFSDSPEKIAAFLDTAKIEGAYPSGSIDSTMRSFILSGTVSGSVQVKPPDTNWFPTYLVAARHGFVFSQNDNYGYDSIVFGGLKK